MTFKFLLLKFLCIFLISNYSECQEQYDVTKYGADLKGVQKSTSAIREAIETASKKGGGTVYFPAGQYLTGPIHLKSNITLLIADNVTINFSTDFDDYLPMIRMRWEGTQLINFSPLIYAEKVDNIAIRGNGILDGQGKYWWDYRKKLSDEFHKTGATDSKWQKEFFKVNNLTQLETLLDDSSRIKLGFLRPPFIQPIDSNNILIENITVRNSPFWNINPVFCENITITGVSVEAPNTAGNTDGIDPDSCKNMIITNSRFDVGDDCIAIKSGRDLQGRRIGRPTENLIIKDCLMLRGVSGVAVGSEQSGGVRNVSISNCIFNGTDRGIYLKSTQGRGGIVENIRVRNITLKNIKKEAISMTLFYSHSKEEPFSERTPVFRNIDIKNMSGSANHSVVMLGLPESPLENVILSDINITAFDGLRAENTKNFHVVNFTHNSLN
jgi:polygalacturonase